MLRLGPRFYRSGRDRAKKLTLISSIRVRPKDDPAIQMYPFWMAYLTKSVDFLRFSFSIILAR